MCDFCTTLHFKEMVNYTLCATQPVLPTIFWNLTLYVQIIVVNTKLMVQINFEKIPNIQTLKAATS